MACPKLRRNASNNGKSVLQNVRVNIRMTLAYKMPYKVVTETKMRKIRNIIEDCYERTSIIPNKLMPYYVVRASRIILMYL